MKKIYSIVLMATALLIGTNVWAATIQVGTADALATAFTNAVDDDVIELTANITIPGYDGTGKYEINSGADKGKYYYYYALPFVTIDGKKLTLNLNGKTIADDPAAKQYRKTFFYLKKGELNIVGPGTISLNNNEKGVSSNDPDGGYPLFVSGNGDHTVTGVPNASKLIIGSGVTVFGNKAGVYIDGTAAASTLSGEYKNGLSGTQAEIVSEKRTTNVVAAAQTYGTDSKGAAYHVYIEVLSGAKVQGRTYGAQISGNIKSVIDGVNVAYLPTIHIHEGAEACTLDGTMDYSAGAYCGGFGHLIIEGKVHGGTGVYTKSGNVEIKGNAEVYSDAKEYKEIKSTSSGLSGAGSGVVIESNKSYAGKMDVTIGGNATIEGNSGYAVQSVTEKDYTGQVETFTISGGNFVSGDKGCLDAGAIIADASTTGGKTEITVSGGTFDNNIESLLTVVPGGYIAGVTQDEDGNNQYVISPLPAGETVDKTNKNIDGLTAGFIEWTDYVQPALTNAVTRIDHLDMLGTSKLDIPAGKKVIIGSVMMSPNSVITVEAGGILIINGENGFVANKAKNLVIKTSEDAPAYFLIAPAAKEKLHPMATVEFTSKSFVNGSNFAVQRFGIPTYGALTSIDAVDPDNESTKIGTKFGLFDYDNNAWIVFGGINGQGTMDYSKMANSFDYYQMINYATNPGTKVIMQGRLVGNEIPQLNVRGNFWNGFSNSMLGNISIPELLDMIPGSVDKAIYLYDINAVQQTWEPITKLDEVGGIIPPMQPFLIRNTMAAATVDVDYYDAIYKAYDPDKASTAPARRRVTNNWTMAKLIVKGENCKDRVLVAEGEEFSAEFDNGYDAAKYMNDGINMYVMADEKMSNFATDNLDNTYVGFQTVNGGNYTIEFANVNGEDLTLIDLATGDRIAMVEGNVYEFTADATIVSKS